VSYTYDNVGNRTAMTSTLGAVPGGTFSYDNDDRLSIDTYDANGNTISSAGIAHAYDFENRMVQKGAVTIAYDGDGNRVSETAGGVTTKYLVDELNPTGYSQVVDELVSGAVTRTYTYGLMRLSQNRLVGSTWVPSFYGYDAHGNVRFLTNMAGAITDTYQYDAFGMPIASTGTTPNDYLYSGERLDGNTNLYQLRARWYRPAAGRFITRDPWEHKSCCGACSVLGSNPYSYADADPVNRTDPSGNATLAANSAIYLHVAVYTTATILYYASRHGMDCHLFDEIGITDPWTRQNYKICLYLCADLTVTTRQGWWGVPCPDVVPED
jgi:RHS repeat-associated protein